MVELGCPMKACIFNEDKTCVCDRGVELKWRLAADLGKGSIVMMECLNMVLDEVKANES